MKLALIPPMSLLEHTRETDFQLMLPQLADNPRYGSVYKHHCNDSNQFVILDNGMAEGVEIPPAALMWTAEDCGVDEVVIPDAMGNGLANLGKAERFLDKFGQRPRDLNLMFVIQGSNWDEFRMNILFGSLHPLIDTIGIPRHAVSTLRRREAREMLVMEVALKTNKPIHLLGGVPTYPDELRFLPMSVKGSIRSTDTSSPFNYAFAKDKLLNGRRVDRPANYFDLPEIDFDEYFVRANINSLKEWVE